MIWIASMADSTSAPKSISTFASTATSGLDGTSIVELEEFVAQFLAFGVAKLVAPGAVFGTHHSARRGLLNSLFLRFHVRQAAIALRGGQLGRRTCRVTAQEAASLSSPPRDCDGDHRRLAIAPAVCRKPPGLLR